MMETGAKHRRKTGEIRGGCYTLVIRYLRVATSLWGKVELERSGMAVNSVAGFLIIRKYTV